MAIYSEFTYEQIVMFHAYLSLQEGSDWSPGQDRIGSHVQLGDRLNSSYGNLEPQKWQCIYIYIYTMYGILESYYIVLLNLGDRNTAGNIVGKTLKILLPWVCKFLFLHVAQSIWKCLLRSFHDSIGACLKKSIYTLF